MRRGHDDGDARGASATRGGADAPATHDHRGPRFVTHSFPGSFEPHPYHPGRLDLERSIGEATGGALAALGHRVQWLPDLSIGTAGVCAISADLERGILYGGADPRRAARAMGW
jgi:gamma-glutamyltranspeptidase/glutathione hydrolase